MTGKRDPSAAFFRGAFEAWLHNREEGDELHLVEEPEGLYAQISTADEAHEERVLVEELGRAPRSAGADALVRCLERVRPGGGDG